MLGAGAAGIGVLDQLVSAMVADTASEQEAIDQVHVLDIGGLLLAGHQDLTAGQRRYTKRPDLLTGWGVDIRSVVSRALMRSRLEVRARLAVGPLT